MRILVIKLSSLGDLFHALPAVHCIKRGTGAELDWVVQTDYVDLVRCFTDVDRVIPFHRRAFLANISSFLRDIRAHDYDLVIDLQGLWKSALASCMARGGRKIGPSFHREGTWLVYSSVAGPRNRKRHAVEEMMDVVRYLDLPVLDPVFPVAFPLQKLEEPRPRVALMPFSRWPSKNWPLSSFLKLGKELREQMNASIFVVGGPDDAAECKVLAKQLFARNMAGELSLPELGGFLMKMDLVVSNDSGPMHMAAAVGTSVLALFGPTDPVRTGPHGDIHRAMSVSLKCSPCRSRKCRFGDASCLSVLTPEMVGDAAMLMLHRKLVQSRLP